MKKLITLLFFVSFISVIGQTRIYNHNIEGTGWIEFKDTLKANFSIQDYYITSRGGDRLSFLAADSNCIIDMFGGDGDGTEEIIWNLWGKGTPSDVSQAFWLRVWYNLAADEFCITSKQTGAEEYKDILISADGSPDQFRLDSLGNVEIRDSIIGATWGGVEIDTVKHSRTTDSLIGALADKSVTIPMLADGTDGELITWDASGVAATVAVGTATHVLTSNGVGVAPTFQASGGGGGGVESFTITAETAATISSTTRSFLGTSGANFVTYSGTGASNEESGWTFVVPENWTSGMRIDLYGVTAATTDSLGFEMTVTISTVGETRSTTTQTLAFKNTVGSPSSWDLWTIQDYIITSTLVVGDVVTLKINRPAMNSGDTYGADGFIEFIRGEFNY